MSISLVIASFLLQPTAAVATADPLQTSADRRAEIVSVEATFTAATRAKDMAALRGLLAPDFVLTGEEMPAPLPGSVWGTNLQRMTLHAYSTRVVDVKSYGNLVIATVEGEWEVQLGPEPKRSDKFLLADFWTRRDGRWQITRRHIIG